MMQKKYAALTALSLLLASPAMAAGNNGVAAVVNGEKITVEQIKNVYDSSEQIKNQVSFKDFYNKTLDTFVNGKVIYQEAVKAKVTETPEYKAQLDTAKEELARKIYLEKLVDENVSDADIKKLYDEYTSNFKPEKEIKAKHILVQTPEAAKEVIAKLNGGEKFDDLAKKYSKEPAELGYFTKKVMVPEFGDAAFAMNKGEYSKTPVKTQFGYHVILVEDVRTSKPVPMERMKPQLKGMLAKGALAQAFKDVAKNTTVQKYDYDGKLITTPVQPQAAAQ